MKEPEFTEREKFLIHYYRSEESRYGFRHFYYDSASVVGSIVALLLYFKYEDIAWVFVSYAWLLWKIINDGYRGRSYSADLRSIMRKYDEKFKSLKPTESKDTSP